MLPSTIIFAILAKKNEKKGAQYEIDSGENIKETITKQRNSN